MQIERPVSVDYCQTAPAAYRIFLLIHLAARTGLLRKDRAFDYSTFYDARMQAYYLKTVLPVEESLFMSKNVLIAALALAGVIAIGCSPGRSQAPGTSQSSGPQTSQLSEITYERIFGCEGPCPLYKVVLRKDGTASYVGSEHAERKGNYHAANIDSYFNQLSKLIDREKYFSLQDSYGPRGEDEGVAITSVANDSRRKTVVDTGSHGPIELWAIEMSIEASVSQIKWEKDP
ncbi:MAG TPA: DUF6438 domain-containing protein [Pyrinomonadaceae bacterium]|nr:DUF6438 domain-containing protein [Pyrinomonadaceae bacterium]